MPWLSLVLLFVESDCEEGREEEQRLKMRSYFHDVLCLSEEKGMDIKMKRDIWTKNSREIRKIVCVALAAVLIGVPAYADELATQNPEKRSETGWKEEDKCWYYYDENGMMKTGWIQASEDGLWYKMDEKDGSWIRRPALDSEAVVYLLENAIKKMGHYQNEEYPVVVREDWRNENIINMSVRIVIGPNQDQILNHYEVNRKSGQVKAAVGENFNLYD